MKTLISITLLFSLISVADETGIPNVCYPTVEGTQFCTAQQTQQVQVFIYNAGWCPPCNSEMSALSRAYSQFAGKPVTFASLSGEGFSHGSQPDLAFLKSWKLKHNIPFVVAGKYKDFGNNFGANGYIPFSVIVNKTGNIHKTGNLEASEIIEEVNHLLKE